MSYFINDPKYWEGRANECRVMAKSFTSTSCKALLRELAQTYDELAAVTRKTSTYGYSEELLNPHESDLYKPGVVEFQGVQRSTLVTLGQSGAELSTQ